MQCNRLQTKDVLGNRGRVFENLAATIPVTRSCVSQITTTTEYDVSVYGDQNTSSTVCSAPKMSEFGHRCTGASYVTEGQKWRCRENASGQCSCSVVLGTPMRISDRIFPCCR